MFSLIARVFRLSPVHRLLSCMRLSYALVMPAQFLFFEFAWLLPPPTHKIFGLSACRDFVIEVEVVCLILQLFNMLAAKKAAGKSKSVGARPDCVSAPFL